MATRFFRKMGDSGVPLSNGQRAKFTSLDGGITSYKAINDDFLAGEFERAMREGRSGLTEIDYETFNRDFLVKKNSGQTSKAPWREEFGSRSMLPSDLTIRRRLEAAQAVVGVVNPPPPPAPVIAPSPMALNQVVVAQVAVNQEIAAELPKAADYKPPVGKRKKAKTA